MMIRPSLEEIRAYAAQGEYRRVPVSTEILSDLYTPMQVLRKLKNVSDHCYLLESAEAQEKWGRYTFLGFDPTMEITCLDGHMKVGALSFDPKDPGATIRQILQAYRSPRLPFLPPFAGGLVGYFSYDYLKYAEPSLRLDAEDTEHFKDVDLMLFDKVIAFDNLKQKIILIVSIDLAEAESAYRKAERELENLIRLIRDGAEKEEPAGALRSEFRPLFDEPQYCAMIERAKHHIHEGDIFQIVLSNRLEADYEGSLLNCYRMLRTLNPSPYLFYIDFGKYQLVGSSPESLVRSRNGKSSIRPIAGTCRRGKNDAEDEFLKEKLLSDPKERAEHLMLVDLARNDLGRVSEPGTVKVTRNMECELFSHVIHLVSEVEGKTKLGLKPIEVLRSAFPAGTVSGAPKISAIEIVSSLEREKRNFYAGAVGYLDADGDLDFCIAIRCALRQGNVWTLQAGSGIVYASDPEREWEETGEKLGAMVQVVEAKNK